MAKLGAKMGLLTGVHNFSEDFTIPTPGTVSKVIRYRSIGTFDGVAGISQVIFINGWTDGFVDHKAL